jgi:ribosomal protein S18 acetylase RimI-like enzyme
MGVSIIEVTAATAGLLENVDPDVFDHPIDPSRLAAYVADPLHVMFVAVENNLVVGQIRGNVHLQPDRAPDLYIDNLGTSPARQRRGIAAAMIKALIEWGKGQGCTFAWVATETDNDGAIGFYGAQNFTHDTIALFAQELD